MITINCVFRKSLFWCLLSSFFFVGCQSVFYYPDHIVRVTPDKLGLNFEDLTIETEDHEKLHAWFIKTNKPKPFATLIHFHGNGANMTNHIFALAWVVNLGFDLIEFDYRGYGSSTGEPSQKGLFLDGKSILNWSEANIRTKDAFIIGQSLGGAVAVPAFAKNSIKSVRAVILDSTFASYSVIARRKLSSIWLTWPLSWPLSLFISNEINPIDYINEIKVPIVFIHSKNDNVVPFESGEDLYIEDKGIKEFWEQDWEGHTTAFVFQDNRYRVKLVSYLCDKLLTKNPDCSTQNLLVP